jgi:hypothetical protein
VILYIRSDLIRLIIPLFMFVIIVGLNGTASAINSNNVIIPNSATTIHGVPYKDWIAKWWVWWIGIPNDIHPESHHDAKACSVMQDGPVWFLPGISPGEGRINYQCNVPNDKDIMLRLTSTECESGGVEGLMTDEQLKDCAFNINTPIENMHLTVDGTEIDLSKLGTPVQTDFFNVTYPQNPTDMWGPVKPGTYRAIAEGYDLFFHGLPQGKHVIELKVIDVLKGRATAELPAEGVFEIFVQ